MKQLVETYKRRMTEGKDYTIFYEDFFLIAVVNSSKDIILLEKICDIDSPLLGYDFVELNNGIFLDTDTLATMVKNLRKLTEMKDEYGII